MTRPLSMYTSVWMRLKLKERVRLEVAPDKEYTVRRMISKIKNQDIGFKMMNDNKYFLEFSYDPQARVMIVELRTRFGVFDKVVC